MEENRTIESIGMLEEKSRSVLTEEIINMEEIAKTITPVNNEKVFTHAGDFQNLFNIGKMFAYSNLVPQAYQGKAKIMDCAIAVDMANRMGVSPMMVMQNLYVVKGKPSWSGQACIALIKASGEFKNVSPVYVGEKGTDERGCYVKAERIDDSSIAEGPTVNMKMVKAEGWSSNKKWQTMPELMLAYRAAAFFARIYIPNALMGCHVEGEAEDIAAGSNASKSEAIDPFASKNQEDKK